ncbi:MAG: cystathionine gamma-synthase [Gammaproteobacteria bacterium]|nr:cystathionine gamma-synthase [Gammaproteobacteria bacterium]
MSSTAHISTKTVRQGLGSDTQHNAVVPPMHLSSTFQFDGFERKGAYDYGRSGNPTRDELAAVLAELEGGAGSVITGSGMAAINLVTALLNPGDVLLAPHDCYGGTHRLLSALHRKGVITVEFVNQSDPAALSEAFALAPRMILCETPSNPLLRITDLAGIRERCKRHRTLLVADNTFLSPGLQNPIAHGADIVLHSTTKYINGHSDVVGGAVIAATSELHEELSWWANCIGATGAPFDSFLTLRGLRTLHTRLRAHETNAGQMAAALSAHPFVKTVYYPGLESHPGHEIARRQQQGYGGMISFEMDGGREQVATFLDNLRYFFLAESLGGVESLVAHPASMTHAAMDERARETAGISDGLIRLSIGIEHAGDLISDVNQALDCARHCTQSGAKIIRAQLAV